MKDNARVDIWKKEFEQFDAAGTVPALSIVRPGNDHTNGTRVGWPTPRAMVAENDLAIGRLIEGISHSRAWKESAGFILEDDARGEQRRAPADVRRRPSPGARTEPARDDRKSDALLEQPGTSGQDSSC